MSISDQLAITILYIHALLQPQTLTSREIESSNVYYIIIHAYIDACSLMCFGHNNIFHFLCGRVLLRTEPHYPWKDLPGAVHHTNPHTHRVQSNTTGPTAVLIT